MTNCERKGSSWITSLGAPTVFLLTGLSSGLVIGFVGSFLSRRQTMHWATHAWGSAFCVLMSMYGGRSIFALCVFLFVVCSLTCCFRGLWLLASIFFAFGSCGFCGFWLLRFCGFCGIWLVFKAPERAIIYLAKAKARRKPRYICTTYMSKF